MTTIAVSGLMFLLVQAYLGCPESHKMVIVVVVVVVVVCPE